VGRPRACEDLRLGAQLPVLGRHLGHSAGQLRVREVSGPRTPPSGVLDLADGVGRVVGLLRPGDQDTVSSDIGAAGLLRAPKLACRDAVAMASHRGSGRSVLCCLPLHCCLPLPEFCHETCRLAPGLAGLRDGASSRRGTSLSHADLTPGCGAPLDEPVHAGAEDVLVADEVVEGRESAHVRVERADDGVVDSVGSGHQRPAARSPDSASMGSVGSRGCTSCSRSAASSHGRNATTRASPALDREPFLTTRRARRMASAPPAESPVRMVVCVECRVPCSTSRSHASTSSTVWSGARGRPGRRARRRRERGHGPDASSPL